MLLLAGASRAVSPLHATSLLTAGTQAGGAAMDELATLFAEPGASSAPHTYWMWMNGNVTREGITLDLETMQRCGIGGVYLYNCAVGIPRGPVDYGSVEWLDIMHHAVSEAARVGVTVAMHNAPGYSGTGGPWITPELSMQELVWTETIVDGRAAVDVELPQPRMRKNYYRDAFVLAYPALPVEAITMRECVASVYCNQKPIEKGILWNGNRSNMVRLEQQTDGTMGTLDLQMSTEFEARAIAIYRSPEDPIDPFDGPRDYPPVLTLQVSEDGQNFKDVCTVPMPALRSMNSPGVQSFDVVKGKCYRLQSSRPTWITGLELYSGPRLRGWAGKANGAPQSAQEPEPPVAAALCIAPDSVRDISEYMDAAGRLRWKAPAGRWTIVRIGHTTTAEVVAAAADSGRGLECDKFAKEGVDLHFTKSLDPLFERLGPLVGTALSAISIDSWEAGKQNWTPLFPDYFEQKCGYDIKPYLLAMTGRVVGSVASSNQFLFDVRRTQAQMLAENYYGHYQARLHAHGLQLHAEPYGDGTFESMQIAEHLDVTMAEFWVRYTYGAKAYADLAAGATHTLGQKIAASEAFTGAPLTSRWTGHPYALKAEGDRMFCLGINRFVFHTFAHQPHSTVKPGMSMGPFGTHFDRNNTWMAQDTGWISYLRRSQTLLQAGEPVIDICYLKSEEPSSGVPDARTGKLAVPDGFAVDIVSADSVMHAQMQNGRVAFWPGMNYACMILPPLVHITPLLLTQISLLVQKGMTLVSSAIPVGSPSLVNQPGADAAIATIPASLWGDLDGKTRTQRSHGRGRVFLVDSLEEVLPAIGLVQDFKYTADSTGADLMYFHRRIADDDVYFVSNQRRRTEKVVCSFRIADARPEIWNAETGVRGGAPIYRVANGRTQVQLNFDPAASVFIIFRRGLSLEAPITVSQDTKLITGVDMLTQRASTDSDRVNDFCQQVWAQPETYGMPGTGFLAFPDEGVSLYGKGHAVAGVTAGQNGVRVYECSTGAPRLVLEANHPLSGWTHIALMYRAGKPTVYVNGVEIASGKPSSFQVHSPRDRKSLSGPVPKYFEGNMTTPQVTGVLTAEELRRIVQTGPPAPELPQGLTLERSADGSLHTTAWSPGSFQIAEGAKQRTLHLPAAPRIQALAGPWELQFPEHCGVPRTLTLPTLVSLNQHQDFGVRHFSGTLTYRKPIQLKIEDLTKDCRLFLDLGRLDVAARVRVNGKQAGSLWKPPYRLEITPLVHAGDNELEIDVTTLWPNRLIGDEHLPVENEYDLHGPIQQIPEWFTAGKPKPGERITFACWHSYEKTDPLLQSGLTGPVRLLYAISV
jgi:hypothetical protein